MFVSKSIRDATKRPYGESLFFLFLSRTILFLQPKWQVQFSIIRRRRQEKLERVVIALYNLKREMFSRRQMQIANNHITQGIKYQFVQECILFIVRPTSACYFCTLLDQGCFCCMGPVTAYGTQNVGQSRVYGTELRTIGRYLYTSHVLYHCTPLIQLAEICIVPPS